MAGNDAKTGDRKVNLSTPFIERPVATTLLTIGLMLAGAAAFPLLPVSPLPQVDFPTISVQASLPGASPETMAALLGAVPLAFGSGIGSELRKPLGICIIGGLLVSQVLTLFTTPVIYIYLDRLSSFLSRSPARAAA